MPGLRLIATACAVTLAAGVGSAVAAGRASGPQAPARTAATSPAAVSSRPVPPAPAPVTRSPRPSHPARRAASPEAAAPLYPLPAAPVAPAPCPPPPRPPGPPPSPLGPPRVAESAVPVAPAPAPHRPNLAAVAGKGIWLTVWAGSTIDPAAVVAQARAAGLHQLWVRTGGTNQGFYGNRVLAGLLPAAHQAGLAVIAWDFPTLSDPRADAARARAAFRLGVDGFSPDIETWMEGTYDTARRVAYYLALVRAIAGNRPVVATVPRPTSYFLSTYPYGAEAPYIDAYAPMVYWSCTEPGTAVADAIAPLARLRPVAPVGQSYDMGPEGGRVGLPTGREIWRFLDVSRRLGSVGASLYLYEQTGPAQWRALGAYPWR